MYLNPDPSLITNKKFVPAFGVLCADVRSFFVSGKQYAKDAALLRENSPAYTPSFHLLSSLSFELLPKTLIGCEVCLRRKGEEGDASLSYKIREEISSEMSKFGHDIRRLYENFPDLMRAVKIEKIDAFKNGYMSEYRIKLEDMDYLVCIKDIEAARYKSFSKNMDIVTDCEGDGIIIGLLNHIADYVYSKYRIARTELTS